MNENKTFSINVNGADALACARFILRGDRYHDFTDNYGRFARMEIISNDTVSFHGIKVMDVDKVLDLVKVLGFTGTADVVANVNVAFCGTVATRLFTIKF